MNLEASQLHPMASKIRPPLANLWYYGDIIPGIYIISSSRIVHGYCIEYDTSNHSVLYGFWRHALIRINDCSFSSRRICKLLVWSLVKCLLRQVFRMSREQNESHRSCSAKDTLNQCWNSTAWGIEKARCASKPGIKIRQILRTGCMPTKRSVYLKGFG